MKFAPTLAAAALLFAAVSPAFADQPHMEEALRHLERARESLQRASSDKGGNRADALRAVDKAIAEVQRGIDYDRKHKSLGESIRR